MTLSTKSVAVVAALVTAAATVVAAPAAEAAGRGTTHVHATKKHHVVAPATVHPGLAHLRNDGSRPVVILRRKHEGIDSLVRYANAKSERTGKKLFSRFGFVELTLPHADDYVRLARGTYYLLDGSAERIKAGIVSTLVVKGSRSDAVRPRSTRNITVSGRGAVGGATTGSPKPYLRLRNDTASPRIVQAMKIKSSATAEQVNAVLARPSYDKLYDLVDEQADLGFLGYVGSHQDVTTRTALKTGRYFVLTMDVFTFSTRLRPGSVHPLTLG